MTEIVTIPDKIRTSDIPDSELNTIGKFSKKVIHHNAGAPTVADDTGLGYAVGSIWVDSTNGDMYTAVSVTAEDANWKNMDGDNVNDPFTLQGSTYGFYCGGDGPVRSEKITRITFAAPNDASDVAEMIGHRSQLYDGSCRNTTHSFICGGYTSPGYGSNPGGRYDIIERFSLTAPHAGADVGEMTEQKAVGASLTDGTTGLLCGGGTPGSLDKIEQFTLGGSPITATDTSAELITARNVVTGLSDAAGAKGYVVGGENPGPAQKIDSIEGVPIGISPGGSTSDYGELSTVWGWGGGSQSPTHGYIMGAYNPSLTDAIEKFPFATSGSTTDVGELSQAMANTAGCQGPAFLLSMGAQGPLGSLDRIDKVTYPSDAGGTDVGNLVDALMHGYGTEV